MKVKATYFAALVISALISACNTDLPNDMDGVQAPLVLKIQPTTSPIARMATETGDNARNENLINRLHIVVYPHSAAGTAAALYMEEVSGLNFNGTVVNSQQVALSRSSFASNTLYDIYVIANLPPDVSITSGITLNTLKALHTQTALNAAATQSNFVMDAMSAAIINPSVATSTIYVDIALRRAVSKVKINIAFANGSPVAGASTATAQLKSYVSKGAIVNATPYTITAPDYSNTGIVTGTPTTGFVFYSYENNWSSDPSKETYVILNIPYSGHTSNYYRLAVNPYADLNSDGQSPSATNVSGRLQRNVLYDVTAYIDKWGSDSEVGAVSCTGSYTRTSWSTGGNIDLSLGTHWLIVYNYQIQMSNTSTYTVGFSTDITPVSISNVQAYYYDYKNSGATVQTFYASGDVQYPSFSVDQTTRQITITSAIPTNFVPKIITFKATNGTSTSATVTITQTPPIYVIGKTSTGNLSPDWSNRGSINTMFTITTTIPSATNAYILGDPTNGNTKTDSTANGNLLLSPKFIISSQWGDSPQLTYAQASYRSTVFAEDIYRSGWRMPTRAEVELINTIANSPGSAVQSFFQNKAPYWSAFKYQTYSFINSTWSTASASTNAYIRCVYDVYKYQ